MEDFVDDRIHPKFKGMFADKGVNQTLDNVQSSDAYEEARQLYEKIQQLKAELKATEDNYDAVLYEIKEKNLVSPNYYLAEQKVKKINLDYFKTNLPEYYQKHAHIPHAYAVNIMNKVYGGEQKFQQFLMTTNPAEFEKHATITVSDVTKDFDKDEMNILKEQGGIEEAVKGYVVKPKFYGGVDVSDAEGVSNGN